MELTKDEQYVGNEAPHGPCELEAVLAGVGYIVVR